MLLCYAKQLNEDLVERIQQTHFNQETQTKTQRGINTFTKLLKEVYIPFEILQ